MNSVSEDKKKRVAPSGAPLASIVLMTYNHGLYIRKSIEGMLEQKTSFSFELLIAEDFSTDGTREIVFEYQRAHPDIIRVITSDKNVGANANCRRVEQYIRGQYVCYCDGDDYWTTPDKLERQVHFLEAHPDYAMVHTAFTLYYLKTGKFVSQPLKLPADLDDADAYNELLSGRRHVWPLTACIRRPILEQILRDCPECYDTRFLMGDTQRWLEIARLGKIKYFPEATATHQVLLESLTQSKNPARVLQFAISNMELFDHYLGKYECSEEARKGAKTRCAFYLLTSAYAAHNPEVARTALAEYRKVGARVPLQAHLYCFGSQSPVRAKLVRPVLAIAAFSEKVWRRVAAMFKSVR